MLPGRVLPGITLPGRGLVTGPEAEVQHARKARVPVRHSGSEEGCATKGSEYDQAADKPRRRGSRT
jgi:hypothetical protein